jgi:molybdopterin converting factor small subunit
MKTTVIIPSFLREYTGNNGVLKIEGDTTGEVLDNLTVMFFPLRQHLFSNYGKIRSTINIYLNDTDIKLTEAENLPLKENDVIKIIPTVTGGFKD